MSSKSRFQQILGVRFFVGDAQGAIEEVSHSGGLVVVPAAPALKNLAVDKGYREALLGADFAREVAESTSTTVAGLLNRIAGHVPRSGERIDYRGLRFEVVEANQRKVLRLRVRPSAAVAPAS